MTMSLLEIVQRTARRLSLPVPTVAFSSTDPTWMQGVEILQDLGEELAQKDWEVLRTSKSITISAVNFHAEPLPADWSNIREDGRIFRNITFQPLIGPLLSSEWEQITIYGAGFIPGAWRLFNNAINIYGVAVGEVVQLEYTSRYWITDGSGMNPKATWTADTDLPKFSDQLLRLGLQWKWKRAKGFDYGEEKDAFEKMVESNIGDDRGLRTIQTARVMRGSDLADNTWPRVVTP
jgi:hypothetical protein